MSHLSPAIPANQSCPMHELCDAELSEIFKRLPPQDRLLASEVCRLWHGIIRSPWRDVTALDLNPIPGAHIRKIIEQCPNLRSVFALRKSFGLGELSILHQARHVTSVKLYDCTFAVRYEKSDENIVDYVPMIFSENLQHASWNELVLHNERIERITSDKSYGSMELFRAAYLPTSLTHLQITGWRSGKITATLQRLRNLECLMILHQCIAVDESSNLVEVGLLGGTVNLADVQYLREICLGSIYRPAVLTLLISRLPQLEVLFADTIYMRDDDVDVPHLIDVVTKPSRLRILVLTGRVLFPGLPRKRQFVTEISARKRFPNGFGGDPLPLLNIFVSDNGKVPFSRREVARWIDFTPSDAAAIYTIDAPMAEFLDRADIAPIFEGVWIAEKIKEAAKYGGELLGIYNKS